MTKKKIFFLFLSLLFLLLIIISLFILIKYKRCRVYSNNSNNYNTIYGVPVTKNNLCSLVAKTPKDIYNKVTNWFQENGAYNILVRQKKYLIDVGTCDRDARHFFKKNNSIKNIGGMNYIFKLPSDDLIVKISGPSNRLYNTAAGEGFDSKTAYFRSMYTSGDSTYDICCEYMSFEDDKKRIKNCLYRCCPECFLQKCPNKKQLQELIYQLCGALAQKSLSGIAEHRLYQEFLRKKNFGTKNFYQACDLFLDKIYDTIAPLCYTKEKFNKKSFADTYNTASRVFHLARFNEAINTFNLDKLQKAPSAYIINLNPGKPDSCSDKDIVVVQKLLKNCKSTEYYMKSRPEIMDEIFTKETLYQLLQAIEYSGLWDINGDNIFINMQNKKIIYMDYEHARMIAPNESFNQSVQKVKDGFCQALLGFMRLFKRFPRQYNIITSFIKEYNIDVDTYIKKQSLRGRKSSRNFDAFSPLGCLLCYQDVNNNTCKKLKKIVYERLNNVKYF